MVETRPSPGSLQTGLPKDVHMPEKNTGQDTERLNRMIADARRERERWEKGYRSRALKIFPPICAHCGREFEGKRLSELTVHHKDGNHDNNPPDGSNWELLCIYCHDYEHSPHGSYHGHGAQPSGGDQNPRLTYRPFANLRSLLEDQE